MTRTIALLGMAFALAVTIISTAYAGGKDIKAKHAWARPSIGDRPGAVYFELRNKTRQNIVIVGASTPIAKKAEIHVMSMESGIMRMRRVETLEVPSGGRLDFKPGSYHVMLFDLKKPLKKGAKFPLTLTFNDADPITFKVKVKKKGGDDDGDDDDKKKIETLTGRKLKDLTPSAD